MTWNAKYINEVAISSAHCDYEAFDGIALAEIDNAAILDVGCFDGFNTVLKFKPYQNATRVVGIDPMKASIELAKKQTDDKRFSWQNNDIEGFADIALKDKNFDGFDLIYFSHVLQHVKDKQATLDAAFKLLKKGGFIVIKTFDDSCKLSYPDPNQVMKRLFALYEKEIAPRVEHTRYTDRNNGQKCPALLKSAGFENIHVKIHTTDTLNKTLDERMDLFERFTYFRQKSPEGLPQDLAKEQKELLSAWKELFKDENYCHISNTFMVTAQKLGADASINSELEEHSQKNNGEHHTSFSVPPTSSERFCDEYPNNLLSEQTPSITPMKETDLGEVMSIEINAFPEPWTPLAYVSELRYNDAAYYIVAKDENNHVIGYVGWWEALEQKQATIMHIAVKSNVRKNGTGTKLLEYACSHAGQNGCIAMNLLVRSQNTPARAFYKKNGFIEVGTTADYYRCPKDDGIAMQKELQKQ